MRKLIAALALLLVAASAHADPLFTTYIGANGVWFDGVKALPSDFEAGGNASASLQPHISLVGAAYYGFDHSYLRGSVGARFTATNVDDPNFSVGLGAQYHMSSEPNIRPEGWAPDATLGWRPWPEQFPAVLFIAQGSYNVQANQAVAIAGVRYALGGYR